MTVYARAAHIYRDHGWSGVLPLPPGAKAHPPVGYTGATGVDPTDEQIQVWCETMPDGNIAIRLPDGVIGIDIDAYGDKHGDASLLALEAELGLLPATWRSTSRGLGHSGIRLFRVPPGRYEDKPAPSIEIIQHHHRYVVVMPSIHPEGRPYLWYDADGVEQHRPPLLDELAWLPEPWVDQLRERVRTDTYKPRPHAVDDWSAAVTRAFTKALLDMPGGRHDAALHGCLALYRLYSLEHPGAAQALVQLADRFTAAIADRSSPAQAEKEWRDIFAGARAIVAQTPSEAPKWEPWTPGASQPDVDDWLRTRQRVEDEAPPDPEQPRFAGLIDWATFWNVEHVDEEWLVNPVLAKGRAHALYAPAKAGKSLLALEIAAAAATGRPVLGQLAGDAIVVAYIDFEMTEADVYERLTDLGYGPDDDLSRLHYYLLPDLPALDTVNGGALLLAEMQRIAAELVVVDTVSRSISGAENDADTIINLARHTFTPLKRAGITSLRVDHSGKNLESGQRGTSAKNDDVDVVWRLTVADNGVTLKATHRRLEWVPEVVILTRSDNPLSHQIDPNGVEWPTGALDCIADLERLEVPLDVSVRQAGKLLREAGKGRKTNVVRFAVKERRAQAVNNLVEDASSVSHEFRKRENGPETGFRETLEDI